MRPYAPTLPALIVIDDRAPLFVPEPDIQSQLEALWHWEQMPCEEETEEERYSSLSSDEQEWRDDYYQSIRL